MSLATGERIPGIDAPLPPGEKVLWLGRPDWWALARDAFHVRFLGLYMGGLIAWRLVAGRQAGLPAHELVATMAFLLLVGAGLAGAVLLLAYLSAQAAGYTLTDRRLVLKIGVLVPTVINIPFRQVEGAALRRRRDGTGDISLVLSGLDRIAFLHLWPHARAWHLRQPQPTLRSIPDAAHVGRLLEQALRATLEPGDALATPAPAPPPAPSIRREAAPPRLAHASGAPNGG